MTARMAAIWASRMPGPEIAAVVSCLVVGSGSSAASARTHCIGSKPIGRTTTSSRATGCSSSAASPTTSLNSDSMPAELISSSRFSSQLPPWPPNATAYGSPAFRRSTSACAPLARTCRRTARAAGGHSVVFVDRHVLSSPRCALARIASYVCAVVVQRTVLRPLRVLRFGVESRWLRSSSRRAAERGSVTSWAAQTHGPAATKSVIRARPIFGPKWLLASSTHG